ncbi:MAG: metallophosphoesterase [Candidatus Melainabacteria bacterium]|nr:metallophosphoesterase [Candidatus Melainabacteria bacterium]
MLWLIALTCLSLLLYFLYRRQSRPEALQEPATAKAKSGKYNWESPTFEAVGPFFIKPWLQPGNHPHFAEDGSECMEVLFHTARRLGSCRVEVRELDAADQSPILTVRPDARTVNLVGVANQVQYVARLTGLKSDTAYGYKIFFGVEEVHSSTFSTRKSRGQEFRAIVFGDMGSGSPWQKQVAYQMSLPERSAADAASGKISTHRKPRGADLLIGSGDIVYHHGRFNEYLSRFFPVYQAGKDSPETGAALLDKSMFISCVGNHDMAKYDPETLISFSDYPDLMAYFALFSLPLNGFNPEHDLGENEVSRKGAGTQQVGANLPPMTGDRQARQALLDAADGRYPRMANFSYDYGNAHFLFLDANTYMDWSEESQRDYVRKDLSKVPTGVWKIVVLHQPPFTSNRKHQREQNMRFLADIFEEQGVAVVFCGHAHSYERSRPIKFKVLEGAKALHRQVEGYVGGSITMDFEFDGKEKRRPNGVIYIVTGGGGAKLDSVDLMERPDLWQPWTVKLIGDRHSFSIVDFTRDTLRLRQIDLNGEEVDRFEIFNPSL